MHPIQSYLDCFSLLKCVIFVLMLVFHLTKKEYPVSLKSVPGQAPTCLMSHGMTHLLVQNQMFVSLVIPVLMSWYPALNGSYIYLL